MVSTHEIGSPVPDAKIIMDVQVGVSQHSVVYNNDNCLGVHFSDLLKVG